MQNDHITNCKSFRRSRGLSTLEMVLCLPILLFVMALMINFGTVASWKIRGLSVSRHAAWGSRAGRSGSSYPRPQYWPATAHIGVGGGSVPELATARIDHPVVRGPLPYGTIVNENLFDPTRGLRRGTAGLDRRFPMLAKMGEYHLRSSDPLLDNKWEFQRMGLSSNRQRRIPAIYELARTNPAFVNAYIQAVVAILQAPFREDLRPLDRDDEFIAYAIRFGWGSGAPDFHPRLSRFCGLSHEVAGERVEQLIDRIRGRLDPEEDGARRIPPVAETMARAFVRLYERVIRQVQDMISADPPPPPGETAAMQGEIAELQAKIDVLNAFLATFPNDGN